MLDTPEIVTAPARLAAAIHLTVPRSEIQNVMGPGLGEIMAAIAAQAVAADGAWFTHHLRMDANVFDFEICVPVKMAVAPTGRVKPAEVPAMTAVQTTYRGPYEGLAAAWGEFDRWIAANGYVTGTDLWESYVSGPESGPDPASWRTQFRRRLID